MRRKHRALNVVLVITAVLLLGSAPTAQAAPHTTQDSLYGKTFSFGELRSGDCQQNGDSQIYVQSDGTGSWKATTLTYQTHSGDIWHSTFTFKTTAGYTLFTAGPYDSPRMSDGNPPPTYSWEQHFTFDPSSFDNVDIYKTEYVYSC